MPIGIGNVSVWQIPETDHSPLAHSILSALRFRQQQLQRELDWIATLIEEVNR